MNQEKIKLIIRNLELLLDSLKEEVYSNSKKYNYDDISRYVHDYDELYEDDD
jgi:hypothetical protein